MAFWTAVALGQFLYYFLFGQYRSSGSDSLPGTILCMAAAGLVGYFAAEMLIKKSFRVFRAGAKGAAIVAGVLVLLGSGMSFARGAPGHRQQPDRAGAHRRRIGRRYALPERS